MASSLQFIVAAGVGFFLVMVLLTAVCAIRKNNRGGLPITSRTPAPTELPSTFDLSSLEPVSMPELLKATRNFSPDLIIGDGSFGLVYKARLPRGLTVAVKKLSLDAFQGFREFQAEMETLSKLRHPNIVTILGYCATGSERVLIYEYIEKGSLDQWLLDTTSEAARSRVPLSWETRGATMATAMGDVYSFGILMLEISTGIRPDLPFKMEEEEGDGKEVRLVEWAKKKVDQDRHMEILDANISREGLKEPAVVEFLRIAILCTSDSSKDRPPMKEVVELLNRISA
ncbi:hypothetical protein RHSIM_RhsimUnG0099100 [Rhododendron simsii]|uniref:Protein kinase domain-containing protein n=1 Tax=Rhododendron simsii TaxID=118357 RepID=A0A834L544_RHOSS|nr:hypothetical protein RHSIM_RhsimUnG0099100 [Rhododendron simsii]